MFPKKEKKPEAPEFEVLMEAIHLRDKTGKGKKMKWSSISEYHTLGLVMQAKIYLEMQRQTELLQTIVESVKQRG